MARVELNTPAPEFKLIDYTGQQISLSAYKGKQPILLVFNRGFFDLSAVRIWRSCAKILTNL